MNKTYLEVIHSINSQWREPQTWFIVFVVLVVVGYIVHGVLQ